MRQFQYMLAPMDKVTNAEFRTKAYVNGADITFTEMARISALARNNRSTLEKIEIKDSTPTYVQIIGSQEKDLDKFLKAYSPPDGFLGFNLNLGCPSPNMVQRGFGCAMIKRVDKVNRLVEIIKKHGYNVSIKLRLGANHSEKERKVYLKLIKEVDADFFVVHAKHGRSKSSDPADWDAWRECVKTRKKIIANGSIKTIDQINELKGMGLSGVMLGGIAIKDPKIFKTFKA